MKKHMALVAILALVGSAHGGVVTLTKDEVASALDIEAAINIATNLGTEPGVVILDGSEGDFVYTAGADRSINIFVSNLTLRGINGALIANCDDGLFFDDFSLSNISIEGIAFQCAGNGIADFGLSEREDVTVRNNIFEAASFGIILRNAVNWTILNNSITAGTGVGQAAVALFGCTDSTVVNNTLAGFGGVLLTQVDILNSTQNKVINNQIESLDVGVHLDHEAAENKVVGNTIATLGSVGILLSSGTFDNKVHGNHVSFLGAGGVAAVQDLGSGNKDSGNKP